MRNHQTNLAPDYWQGGVLSGQAGGPRCRPDGDRKGGILPGCTGRRLLRTVPYGLQLDGLVGRFAACCQS